MDNNEINTEDPIYKTAEDYIKENYNEKATGGLWDVYEIAIPAFKAGYEYAIKSSKLSE